MTEDADRLHTLRCEVEAQIREYVYDVPETSIGRPWSADKVRGAIVEMQSALVDPYWTKVELRDTIEQTQMENPTTRRCAVVADDQRGVLLLWDPSEDSFLLAERNADKLLSFGVRGDAVGCFLSR